MIKVRHVKKCFGAQTVLKDVNFSVASGQIFGLVGHNGAGKTTLMTIIAGLLQADSGTCVLDSRRISYLPDVPAFFDYLNCGEYLRFLASGMEGQTDVVACLKRLQLSEKARIGTMSRGMRQRLGLAGALLSKPDILLLDEPTSALDPAGRTEIFAILRQLRDAGKTVLLSTHVLTDMEKVCDEAAFLHKGSIQRQVSVSALQKKTEWVVRFQTALPEKLPGLQAQRQLEPHGSMQQAAATVVAGDAFAMLQHSVRSSAAPFLARRLDAYTLSFELTSERVAGSTGTDGESAALAESQRAVFQYLASLALPIAEIGNAHQDLDSIFQEVCSS